MARSKNVLKSSCAGRMLLRCFKDDVHNTMRDGHRFPEGAVSSVVEHYLDTVGVTGSNPVSRTIFQFVWRFSNCFYSKIRAHFSHFIFDS